MKLAVIPARGGSKRIPRKNIRPFLGRPMIAYTIDVALESGLFDRVLVSTDDGEIAAVAKEIGVEAPFVRPPELSDDFATTAAVIAHAIDWQRDNGEAATSVCCLYATAPLMSVDDIIAGYSLLAGNDCDFVLPVTTFPFPIQRAVRLRGDGRLSMFDPSTFLTRSQDLEEAYHDAGQFYWGRAEAWREQRPIFGDRTIPLILPRTRVQDIDTLEDWAVAEAKFKLSNRLLIL